MHVSDYFDPAVPEELHDQVVQAFAELPENAEDLAIYLEKLGVKGAREARCGCPLAVFLQRCGVCGVEIGNYAVKTADAEGYVVAELPGEAQRFIHQFDEGEYPALDLYSGEGDDDAPNP